MRSVLVALVLTASCTVQGALSGHVEAATSVAAPTRACGQGYHCQDVHVQLCVKRPSGRNMWALTRKDAHLRRGVVIRDCTQYATGITFTLRYNGKQAGVVKHSLTCTVQAQHGVAVRIKKCYSTVQRSQKHFVDLVAGARVCVRSVGYRGPGCHDDYAINVYAYANGRLTGETFVGFNLHVSNL